MNAHQRRKAKRVAKNCKVIYHFPCSVKLPPGTYTVQMVSSAVDKRGNVHITTRLLG